MHLFKSQKLFRITLQVSALISISVGLALGLLPFGALSWVGLTVDPYRFFSSQAGVFHAAMGIAAFIASRNLLKSNNLLLYIIITKWLSFFFLSFYSIFLEMVFILALSATFEGLMGLLILFFFLELSPSEIGYENSDA